MKKKVGRKPWKPTPVILKKIYLAALKNSTEQSIAKSLGISHYTFIKKKKEFVEILKNLKKGRQDALDATDHLVEAALVRRCLGGDHNVTKQVIIDEEIDPDTDKVKLIRRRTIETEHIGDGTSMFFYLCNRMKDKWVSINKTEVEMPKDIQDTLRELAKAVIKGDQGDEKGKG